jgi:DnaJ-class molecular chaperone
MEKSIMQPTKSMRVRCPKCGGRKFVIKRSTYSAKQRKCNKCHGTGTVKVER